MGHVRPQPHLVMSSQEEAHQAIADHLDDRLPAQAEDSMNLTISLR